MEQTVTKEDNSELKDFNDIINKLPKEQQVVIMREIQLQQRTFSGPLPAPEDLAAYENILKGLANRIVTTFEKQVEHRHNDENERRKSNIKLAQRGQLIGCGLVIFLALIGFGLAVLGMQKLSAVIFSTLILGVISVFVLRKLPFFEKEVIKD